MDQPTVLENQSFSSEWSNDLMPEIGRITDKWKSTPMTIWAFRNDLDMIARLMVKKVKKYFKDKNSNLNDQGGNSDKQAIKIGCSIFYKQFIRQTDNNNNLTMFVLGGATSERIYMDPSARYYNISKEVKKAGQSNNYRFKSFTSFSILSKQCLYFDDFEQATNLAREITTKNFTIIHKPKTCELKSDETKSFICIPDTALEKDNIKSTNSIEKINLDDNITTTIDTEILIRLTTNRKNDATQLFRVLLEDNTKESLKNIMEKIKNQKNSILKASNSVLSVSQILRETFSYQEDLGEFSALRKLTSQIQAIYDPCECSIFLAYPVNNNLQKKEEKEVHLYLAATTALSSSKIHVNFREAFFDDFEAYKIINSNNSITTVDNDNDNNSKTGHTYLNSSKPSLFNHDTSSTKNICEIDESTAFLGLVIPSNTGKSSPYGVIRIVKYEGIFTKQDITIADAITEGLTNWLGRFPINNALQIEFASKEVEKQLGERLAPIIIHPLSNNPYSGTNNTHKEKIMADFYRLLKKIFYKCNQIIIKEVLHGGFSGTSVFLVENDAGLDLILKILVRNPSPNKQKPNLILEEIQNYRKFIEGKLELNHNIIYYDLIRETRTIIGFATNFLGSQFRNRVSISDYCLNTTDSPAVVKSILIKTVTKFIEGIWRWWYLEKNMNSKKRSSLLEIYQELLKDNLFHDLRDKERRTKVFSTVKAKLIGKNSCFKNESSYQTFSDPSKIWDEFNELINKDGNDKKNIIIKTKTHGDVHGGNIFIDPYTDEIWIIDFGRTGERLCIFDLAMFESDLKLWQLPILTKKLKLKESERRELYEIFMEKEQTLACQKTYLTVPLLEKTSIKHSINSDNFRKTVAYMEAIYDVIIQIRILAGKIIGRKLSFSDYKLTLFLFTYKYMKIASKNDIPPDFPYLSFFMLKDQIIPN